VLGSLTIHEGENGAIEPGGMPAIAESKFDEGLKMCPFKCVENFEIKRDLVTFLQNSVRDPKLQFFDMKVKLQACVRLRERMLAIIEVVLYIWPDLPANQGAFSPIDIITNRNSLLDPSDDAPNAMSLLPLFRALSTPSLVMAKFLYCMPTRYTAINASHYNQPATFVYGGLTQHIEVTGNFCADINGNGAGGREDNDGEHAMSPTFGSFADTGEFELAEEELPFVRLVAQKLTVDRMGFGKHRGGLGYEQIVTVKGSDQFGFMTGQCGAKHPSAYGLFGGYACPAYPLAKIKDVNVFDTMRDAPERIRFSMVELMNEQAIPGGRYVMQDAGMPFEICAEGEVYMICQGAGGGYGDVLEREPALVMQDIEDAILTPAMAREVYAVVFDEHTRLVDEAATAARRAELRQARIARGRPFDEFCAAWVKPAPDPALPFFGAWGDNAGPILANAPGAAPIVMAPDAVQGVMLGNPKDRRIAELEAEVATLRARLATVAAR
jgi:acetone carboxylase alpha subunit